MEAKIKEEVIEIYRKLEEAGFEVFLVGGCVRNTLMNRPITDWDLTTNATPEEIQKVFPDSFYDNTYGTVGVPYEIQKTTSDSTDNSGSKNVCEITTFRTEKGYTDKRHPEVVEWGQTIEEDLSRRDFTVNAIALKLPTTNNPKPTFIDPYDGVSDIEKRVIRSVGNADERFKEDALRLMRAVRFATQLRFSIEGKTHEALQNNSAQLKHISNERIRDELLKILACELAYEGIELLDNAGLLEIILPELTAGKGVEQARPGRHHQHDVFTHNLLSLKYCPSEDPIVRLATLIHDVGKPQSKALDENGLVTFYNHEVIGASISKEISDRLRLSKKQREKIYTLIRWHMFTVDENITDSAIRRFIRRVGLENVRDIIDLRIGDRLGSGTAKAESWRLKKFKERIEKELNPPFSLNDLAIDGNDIMKELNLKPGPEIGKILQQLFEEVDEDLEKNNQEYLLERIKELTK